MANPPSSAISNRNPPQKIGTYNVSCRFANCVADDGAPTSALAEFSSKWRKRFSHLRGGSYNRTVVHKPRSTLPPTGASNHDPAEFRDAEPVDITRRAASHLAFGHGARYCIGAPLARIELQTVFSQLVSRMPGLRLAANVHELTMRDDVLTGGLTEPVRW
jgi:hypothetical protein